MKSTKEALARGLKFKQAVKDLKNAEEAEPKCKKNKAEEVDKKSRKQPPAQEVGKKSRKQPPSEAQSVEGCKSNTVSPKAKASKAKAPPELKRKGAFLEEPEVHEPPTKRLKGKTPAVQASHIPDPTPEEEDGWEEETCGSFWDDWGEVSYEYDLWRQGLPQSSELEADLQAHRDMPIPEKPAAVPEPVADQLPPAAGSGSTFVDAEARLQAHSRLSSKDRQDSQTISDIGPSASQVVAGVDMSMLLQRVQQLELEKAELESQLSTDSKGSKATTATEPQVPEASKAPAAERPVATPVRAKEHVFHDSPPPSPVTKGLSPSLAARIRTQADPVPKPTEMPPDVSDPKPDDGPKISSVTHRKEYAKLAALLNISLCWFFLLC
ncbi:unnamed protein product [Symbiodinium sp. KB8]|nr:unnamed protein product [Symbiodinium sp. KB8]